MTEIVKQSEDANPIAKIVSDKPRGAIVPLDWPVEFDGKTITEIHIHRITGGQLDDYLEKVRTGHSSENVMPAIDCLMEVWNALDSEDQYKIDQEVWENFFPQKLKDLLGSAPGTSEDTSES